MAKIFAASFLSQGRAFFCDTAIIGKSIRPRAAEHG
jgi:hypothetical protein